MFTAMRLPLRPVDRAGSLDVERRLGIFSDLGREGGPQGLVGAAGAQEGTVADEEALFVVVGVYQPEGDAVGAVAVDFAGGWGRTRPRRSPSVGSAPQGCGRRRCPTRPRSRKVSLPVFLRFSYAA